MTEILGTERLVLRELEERDLDPLAAMLGDPETMRYYDHPFSREEARDWLDRNRARYAAYGFGLYAIEERRTGAFLGDCGLAVQIVEGEPMVEAAWHVIRSRWRQGIASEAAAAILEHGFGPLGLRRIVALVKPDNEPSRGVAEKLGMSVERELDYKGNPHLLYVR